jgi:voltage-gated potassium channel Kch
VDESAGDAYYASGRWWRMLYVSAVTVTTLGEGDIVPVTDGARRLLTGEVLLGVTFAGLFFNAIAGKIREKQ